MNIADLIAALQAGRNPDQAVIQASMPGGGPDVSPEQQVALTPGIMPNIPGLGGAPPGASVPPPAAAAAPAPAAPPGPPPVAAPGTPTGARTPVTNPIPPPEAPKALQSPPDLANMYVKMIEKNQNAAALDSGLTLMAAGLTRQLDTRKALIGLAGTEGAKGGNKLTSADIINLQKQQQAQKDMLLRRSMLGSLAKQYGLTPEAALALETSGKLDEVIQAYHTGHVIKVTDAATGQESLHHAITGKEIAKVGGEKPDPTQVIEGPQGPELRITAPSKGFAKVGESAGVKPGEDQKLLADINAERVKAGQPVITMEEYLSSVKRAPPNATDEAALAAVNATRPADKQMTMEEFIKFRHPGPQTNVYVGPDGVTHPQPEPGYDYKRGPDGKLLYGENGLPIPVAISEKAKLAEQKKGLDIGAEQKKAEEATKKENRAKIGDALTATNVGRAVDQALSLADKPGATGFGAGIARKLSPGGMPSDTIDSALNTINANTTLAALKDLRASSPTGGGLGNVSNYEDKLLSGTIADLRVYQGTKEFKDKLLQVKATIITLANQSYKEGDAAKFNADLKETLDELRVAEANRGSKGRSKIERVK